MAEPQTQARFVFADRGLRGSMRVGVVGALLAAGVVVQLVWCRPILGGVFVLVGSALTWLKGVQIKPPRPRKREWREVTEEQFLAIEEHARQVARWARHWLNIQSGPGGCCFVVALVVGAGVGWLLYGLRGGSSAAGPFAPDRAAVLWLVWAIDYALLVIALWISGRRSAWTPKDLALRVDCLIPIMGLARQNAMLFEVRPMLELGQYADADRPPVPYNARLMIRLKKAEDWFMGVQVQVSINKVQNTLYPYLYCVLLAKKGHELFERVQADGVRGLAPANTTIEHQEEKDVDVVVVRQHTTRTSGYHTKASVRYALVQAGLGMALAVANPDAADTV